jgi:hypothetical protein
LSVYRAPNASLPIQASPEIQVVTLNPARTFFVDPVSPNW